MSSPTRPSKSFLWHDYETFGANPAADRPSQFAAIRTDASLQEIGESLTWYCQPTRDQLPHPVACLITGITPQMAEKRGVPEPKFASLIHDEMMEPGTCSVGYNSLRFDDEVSRYLFYRNFFDPYEREWKNGNTRFDLINLARMCYALRPEGIVWPEREPGIPSFKLQDLTLANGIPHEGAHDALSDVRATIGLARLIRDKQPRLWNWALTLRGKKQGAKLLDTSNPKPVLHSSGRIPASRGATSLVLSIAAHPDQRNAFIVFDLNADPEPLFSESAQDIADRVFTSSDSLPEGVDRIPLKVIRTNKAPMLAPIETLRGTDPERIGLDVELAKERARQIRARHSLVRDKLIQIYGRAIDETTGRATTDAELALYDGFLDNADRRLADRVRSANGDELARGPWHFVDPRLVELLFRYRARHHQDSLDSEETSRWLELVSNRLLHPPDDRILGWNEFTLELARCRESHAGDANAMAIFDQLESWSTQLWVPPPETPG